MPERGKASARGRDTTLPDERPFRARGNMAQHLYNAEAQPNPGSAPPDEKRLRWILHIDLDAFFASVEELLNPDLRGKPIIVGADPAHRGVVASASYAARKYGVRSAMPTARALKLCPHAIVIHPRHHVYGEFSERVMAILREFSPLLEQISIDEAFLDLTGCERLLGPIPEVARRIQQRVMDEVGLSASVGLASNKLVAKIASDLQKPHGFVYVEHGREAEFLAPLPVERLWGVGKVTASALHRLGVQTIGDLAALPEAALVQAFGPHAVELKRRALGLDDSPVITEWQAKSVSNEETFATDQKDEAFLKQELLRLSDKVAARLRANRQAGRTVRLKLRYHDFTTVLRSQTLPMPTDSARDIYETVLDLWDRHWQKGRAVRLVGVGVANLETAPYRQLGLFDQTHPRDDKLARALDEIREKFGRDAIRRASLLKDAEDDSA
jgi:DNA polymerase-4